MFACGIHVSHLNRLQLQKEVAAEARAIHER